MQSLSDRAKRPVRKRESSILTVDCWKPGNTLIDNKETAYADACTRHVSAGATYWKRCAKCLRKSAETVGISIVFAEEVRKDATDWDWFFVDNTV